MIQKDEEEPDLDKQLCFLCKVREESLDVEKDIFDMYTQQREYHTNFDVIWVLENFIKLYN